MSVAIAQPALLPELMAYLTAVPGRSYQALRHPLVGAAKVDPRCYMIYNRLLRDRQDHAQRLARLNDWRGYLWLYERSQRPQTLYQIADLVPPSRYWLLVADVWHDADLIHPAKAVWTKLLATKRPYRESLMQPQEQHRLRRLKTRNGLVTVYRGITAPVGVTPRFVRGLAWTTDRYKAAKFANNLAGDAAWIVKGTVRKDQIQACFTRRGYPELVVLSCHVHDVSVKCLRSRPLRRRASVAIGNHAVAKPKRKPKCGVTDTP